MRSCFELPVRCRDCIRGCATVLAVCAVTTACAHYRSEPLSAAIQAEQLDSRTLDNPRLQSFLAASLDNAQAADSNSWNLTKLTFTALFYHPDIELARSKLEIASATTITAAQIPNPIGSANLMFSPFTVSSAVNFLIETFGKREYRTAQAEALTQAAREDVVTASWQIRGRVRSALLNLWAAQRRIEYLQQRSTLQDQLVQLLERRLEEGEASALDVTRERINRNQLSLLLRDAERQNADARAQIATSVGVSVQALDDKTFDFSLFDSAQLSVDAVPELRRQALFARSDVQGLLAQYRAAESAVQLEIAKQYPNINIGPGYEYEPGREEYEFTLAAAAELPIFNQNRGPIAEAEARRRGIATQLTVLQAQAIGAIDAALASYRTTTAAVETADALVAESMRRNDQVTRSFQAGEADRPTLVTAGIELATIELSRFEASVQQRQAMGALEDGLQRQIFERDTAFTLPEATPPPRVDTVP